MSAEATQTAAKQTAPKATTPEVAPVAAPATAPVVAPGAVHSAAPIGFRDEHASVADSAVGVLLVLVVLLGACLGGLIFAKRKGWLNRWLPAPSGAADDASRLRVEQVLRLSPRTVLYRVADERSRYLILESTASAQLGPAQPLDQATSPHDPHA
ncbi:hypothetical protein LC55x_1480 [Lysobacter capsici]|uniref:hypothetical protein n=1 Tax=Lysobacter capsici TaxID=435897 RepID=UPI00071655A6|nr:hypothetical protein [Lysobacter capsici]ALN84771.1 hypothetical protein LC55x_1480 [Lysobacter capsici]WND82044.1 hypothetical protein RJ610_06690 [Lysobacter capsici]WND87240.1 hypothetical protein RJ609_06695 [Lysobacter capsici]